MSSGQKRKQEHKRKQAAKKEKRRQAKVAEADRRQTVQQANWITPDEEPRNFLDTTGLGCDSIFRNYAKNNLSVHISYASPSDLSAADLSTMYNLTRANMLEHYNKAAEVDPSDWTWSEKKKMSELQHPDARFLLARATSSSLVGETKAEADGDIVGFAHIRFELEGLYAVTYVYELQVAEAAQKHGLGQRMMQLTELASAKLGMKWVMLTVFKANDAAGNFYTKMKYELDETDPSLCDEGATDEPKPYNIMSKCIDREERARLDAIKFLNNAVAQDEREEQAARLKVTPTKAVSMQKKISP